MVLNDAVERGLAVAQEHNCCDKVHALGILTAPLISRGDLDTVARETEIALACSAELPMAYTQTFEYAEAPPPQWYANSRIFTFSGPNGELTLERQFLVLEPDV